MDSATFPEWQHWTGTLRTVTQLTRQGLGQPSPFALPLIRAENRISARIKESANGDMNWRLSHHGWDIAEKVALSIECSPGLSYRRFSSGFQRATSVNEFRMLPESTEIPLSTTIIIPQFNQPELTRQAIQSLRQYDAHRWPILVVDNGSSAQSLRRLHDLHDPDTEILALPRQGLTAAWNAAARRCQTATLVFLNNDTLSTGPWVEALLAPLENNQAWISGAEARHEPHLQPALQLLAGWCFAVRFDTFLAVDGFDEALQLYFSDTDFQMRVRDQFSSSTIPAWAIVPGLPLSHLSHRTAQQLSNRRPLWRADRERFQARWNRSH